MTEYLRTPLRTGWQ